MTIIATLSLSGRVFSLPEIDTVASGNAKIQYPDSKTLKIDAQNNTIINYKTFNINENESVIITLPSANSKILNKVLGGDLSKILGNLNCNGIFILINNKGIYVGPKANITAAGLVLSTRNMTNQDFLSGNYVFKKLSKDETDMLLLTEGTIKIKDGGFGVLIAGAVENKGTIVAPLGKVVLAGGDAP